MAYVIFMIPTIQTMQIAFADGLSEDTAGETAIVSEDETRDSENLLGETASKNDEPNNIDYNEINGWWNGMRSTEQTTIIVAGGVAAICLILAPFTGGVSLLFAW